ncbi:MAG TPA: ABC transporter ATP-binding protein [Planctomycetota bacterium]|nr:ABC transporter ATP-binding protein [Planctomycetota bacterium]
MCIPLGQAADVAMTVTIGNAIKRAAESDNADWIGRVIWLLTGYAVAQAVFRYFQRWWIVVVSREVEVDLKQDTFEKLTGLSFEFHNRSRSGDVVSRLTSDVENVRMFLGPGLMYTVGAMVVVPISLGVLFSLNAWVTLAMIVPMTAMGWIMKALTPRIHRYSMEVQESLADISHRAQENFGGIRVVQAAGIEDAQAARFARSSERNRDNQIAMGEARGLTHASVNGAFDLTFVVILVVGGLAAIDRTLPIGDLFKFIDLTIKVFWPLIALGWIAGMYARALASAERITELMAEVPSIVDAPDAVQPRTMRGEIDFRDVSFRYHPDSPDVLQHVSVHVPAGTTLGVVGPTGSGKTTLLSLVGRLFDCEGSLSVDGVPIRDWSLASLRGHLGYVPQDSFLFSAPYEDNIRFGADEELSDEAIHEYVRRAAMEGEVRSFPHQYKQRVGERGVTLSGGQRQRTCIARALAKKPQVLILDDCLSAVDTETEKHLLESLREAGKSCTVLVAAHRLSSVAMADQILVLTADGHMEALGTHEELLAQPGWYHDTWERQQRRAQLLGEGV